MLGAAGRNVPVSSPSHHPGRQAIEMDIDDRRCVEGQHLRNGETADNGVTKRLADLRTYATI